MASVIALPCVKTRHTACVAVCPLDCIHPTKDEADFDKVDQLYIDPDMCTSCGLCTDECPVKAIFPEEDLPEAWRDYAEKNAAYFAKR